MRFNAGGKPAAASSSTVRVTAGRWRFVSCLSNPDHDVRLVGFIDDDPQEAARARSRLSGARVVRHAVAARALEQPRRDRPQHPLHRPRVDCGSSRRCVPSTPSNSRGSSLASSRSSTPSGRRPRVTPSPPRTPRSASSHGPNADPRDPQAVIPAGIDHAAAARGLGRRRAALRGADASLGWARRGLVAVVVAYWILTCPAGAALLARTLTADYRPLETADGASGARAVVLLSGGSRTIRGAGGRLAIVSSPSALRALETARVYRLLGRPAGDRVRRRHRSRTRRRCRKPKRSAAPSSRSVCRPIASSSNRNRGTRARKR